MSTSSYGDVGMSMQSYALYQTEGRMLVVSMVSMVSRESVPSTVSHLGVLSIYQRGASMSTYRRGVQHHLRVLGISLIAY